jgi:hypothetical protein
LLADTGEFDDVTGEFEDETGELADAAEVAGVADTPLEPDAGAGEDWLELPLVEGPAGMDAEAILEVWTAPGSPVVAGAALELPHGAFKICPICKLSQSTTGLAASRAS